MATSLYSLYLINDRLDGSKRGIFVKKTEYSIVMEVRNRSDPARY